MFRFLTAGESHGRCLTVIVEGLPAGLTLDQERLNLELARRQQGYGRGGRMTIERDQALVTAGMRHGQTLGSPLAITIENRDWEHWTAIMDPMIAHTVDPEKRLHRPRPGHADLAGALKYQRQDMRDILERASARETAGRVAAGAVAKVLLEQLAIHIGSWVESIGSVVWKSQGSDPAKLAAAAESSDVRCPDELAANAMRQLIDQTAKAGDTVGGIFTAAAWGLPVGLGSHVQWDRRLDTRIAGAIMSIPAIKGVEFGLGFEAGQRLGSQVHDAIEYHEGHYRRATNHAGGLEGGMTTGEPLVVRAAMKPIASLKKPLRSVDVRTKLSTEAGYERSDVCAVPAAGVVAEAMLAMELVRACQEKFGGDSLPELQANWKHYLELIRRA